LESVLTINNLTKRYGKVHALQGLSLDVPQGCVFGLLGPNGSGKTTTLGICLGIINSTSGDFKWFGKNPDYTVRKEIGAILEKPNFYPYLSALENLKIVADIKQMKTPNFEEILGFVGLKERQNHKFSTFSLGMKQRLAIGAAMLGNPKVLILDEPTNGLDPSGIVEIREMILRIADKGITVILASHLLDEVEKVCSHVAILKKGETLFKGTVAELTSKEGVRLEIGGDNLNDIKEKVIQLGFSDAVINGNRVSFLLNDDSMASEINKALVYAEINISHISRVKSNLEKEVLKMLSANA
jgi:ABC-type multidrug transport system ATPase subunit